MGCITKLRFGGRGKRLDGCEEEVKDKTQAWKLEN